MVLTKKGLRRSHIYKKQENNCQSQMMWTSCIKKIINDLLTLFADITGSQMIFLINGSDIICDPELFSCFFILTLFSFDPTSLSLSLYIYIYIYIYIYLERERSSNVNPSFIVNVRTTKIVAHGIFNHNIHVL